MDSLCLATRRESKIEPTRTSDASLVRRSLEGDESAARQLFERYRESLLRRLGRRIPPALGRKVSAADVVQDTYLVALERLSEFEDRGKGSFRRWLFTVAESRLMDQFRRFSRKKRGLRREVTRGKRATTRQVRGGGASPSHVAMGEERRRAVQEALIELPEQYREVLLLVQRDQLKLRSAAERLGRSYEATKKLYGRALKAFAEVYDG